MNPSQSQQLDPIIHQKDRLAILSILASSPALNLQEIKTILSYDTELIQKEIATLLEHGYIQQNQPFKNNQAMQTFQITALGKKKFEGYLIELEKLIQKH